MIITTRGGGSNRLGNYRKIDLFSNNQEQNLLELLVCFFYEDTPQLVLVNLLSVLKLKNV